MSLHQMNDVTRASLAEAAVNLKKKLDKKNLLLARAEEKVMILEARQEEVHHMLMALREEKVKFASFLWCLPCNMVCFV